MANKKRGSGEGTIFEESPGKWVASTTVGYVFKGGKCQLHTDEQTATGWISL